MPEEIATRMLTAKDEASRWLDSESSDFDNLFWFDALTAEVVALHDAQKSAGVKLSARKGQTYMLNALHTYDVTGDTTDTCAGGWLASWLRFVSLRSEILRRKPHERDWGHVTYYPTLAWLD